MCTRISGTAWRTRAVRSHLALVFIRLTSIFSLNCICQELSPPTGRWRPPYKGSETRTRKSGGRPHLRPYRPTPRSRAKRHERRVGRQKLIEDISAASRFTPPSLKRHGRKLPSQHRSLARDGGISSTASLPTVSDDQHKPIHAPLNEYFTVVVVASC